MNITLTSPILILTTLALFGLVHSLTASLAAKATARRLLGARSSDGLYRLGYNLLSTLTILPPFALVALLPDGRPLWTLPTPLRFLTVPLQLAALFGMAFSLWRVDLPRFLGLRQFARWLRGETEPRDPPVLKTDGVHGWVRHPLYFFGLVLLWLTPAMTPNRLALTVGFHAYLWIGSIFEERKLVAEFGETYREHQRRVPRLFPFPRPRLQGF